MRAAAALPALALAACASAPEEGASLINVTFAPWIETAHYETWDFDLEACVDIHDVRVDSELLRSTILETIEEELAGLGVERRPGGEVDFLVYYELAIADAPDLQNVRERTRGRLFFRDVRTGRLVWRAERKTPLLRVIAGDEEDAAEIRRVVRRNVQEMMHYARRLEKWSDLRAPSAK